MCPTLKDITCLCNKKNSQIRRTEYHKPKYIRNPAFSSKRGATKHEAVSDTIFLEIEKKYKKENAFYKPSSPAVVTSFNHTVVRILSRRVCLAAIRIKERLVVVSQVNLHQAVEISGAQREKRSTRVWGVLLKLISLLWCFHHLSSHASF